MTDAERQARLAVLVADNYIAACHCYGHLCDKCAAAQALKLLAAPLHNHKAEYLDNGALSRRCAQCGGDLVDSKHLRA